MRPLLRVSFFLRGGIFVRDYRCARMCVWRAVGKERDKERGTVCLVPRKGGNISVLAKNGGAKGRRDEGQKKVSSQLCWVVDICKRRQSDGKRVSTEGMRGLTLRAFSADEIVVYFHLGARKRIECCREEDHASNIANLLIAGCLGVGGLGWCQGWEDEGVSTLKAV
ncbi:hypothetical protein LZ30DRAFT_212422 [Colletotrichum cereale]|nr:hypothetical protein LZ30DRAFT_212422 [Colletotrichum cereale]